MHFWSSNPTNSVITESAHRNRMTARPIESRQIGDRPEELTDRPARRHPSLPG